MKLKLAFTALLIATAGFATSIQGAIFDNYTGGTTLGGSGINDSITDGGGLQGFAYQFTALETSSLVNLTAELRSLSGPASIDIAFWNDSGSDTVGTQFFTQNVALSDSASLTLNNISESFTSGTKYWISFSNISAGDEANWYHTSGGANLESGDSGVISIPNADGSDFGSYGSFTPGAFAISAVPEPGSIALVSGLCLVGFAAARRRYSKKD